MIYSVFLDSPAVVKFYPSRTVEQPIGKNFSVFCNSSTESSTIIWQLPGGAPLPNNVIDLGNGYLQFYNSNPAMSRSYICNVTNIAGTIGSPIKIQITCKYRIYHWLRIYLF